MYRKVARQRCHCTQELPIGIYSLEIGVISFYELSHSIRLGARDISFDEIHNINNYVPAMERHSCALWSCASGCHHSNERKGKKTSENEKANGSMAYEKVESVFFVLFVSTNNSCFSSHKFISSHWLSLERFVSLLCVYVTLALCVCISNFVCVHFH